DLLLFSDRKRITSVDLFASGLPDNPPTSTLFADCSPSREMVVLVAITPAILVSFTISIISNNCSLVKSGAIFNKICFCFGSCRFLFYKDDNNSVNVSLSCNERKLGVFGELTFTTK